MHKTVSRPAPVVDDEEIDPGLLDHIPDVSEPHEPVRGIVPNELQRVLSSLQREMQVVLSGELARVETNVVSLFADLESRLAEATLHIERLHEENAQLIRAKDRYENAFQTLKELTRDVEGPP